MTKLRIWFGAGMIGVAMAGVTAFAQGVAGETPAPAGGAAEARRIHDACDAPTADRVKTFLLKNATQPSDGNEVQTAVRNMLPSAARVFYVASESTLYVCTSPEMQAVAERMVKELDRPRNRYRLTYTFTETDGGKRTGTQHFSMLVTAGQRMTVKEGSRVPLTTGTYTPGGSAAVQTQYQYIDVGMNFDVTLMETAAGALVKTKVEESSIVPTANLDHPVVRQVSLEGSPTVVLGKPAIVTSLDMPESTRHVDVEVVVEAVP
jgi:hypothetical protein